MTQFAQRYSYADLNSPAMYGAAGAGSNLLKTVLVNGYGTAGISITGITRSGATATATVAAADMFRLKTGSIVTVSGAVQTDYNITAVITWASATTFTYTVANAPTTPATGTIVLSTKLPITSAVESGATITLTLTNSNTTLVTNEYIVVEGLSPAGANGTFQITVVSGTSVSYVGPGSLGAITGTGTYYKAGLGWSNPYTGTNVDAFRPQSVSGYPQFYVRVDDSNTVGTAGAAKEMLVRGYETMSDVNTGTGLFPTVLQLTNGVFWRKSLTADSTTERQWVIYGDAKTFYFIPNSESSTITGRTICGFGGFITFKSGDAYNCFLNGHGTSNTASNATAFGTGNSGLNIVGMTTSSPASGTACFCARQYSQAGGSSYMSLIHFSGAGVVGIGAGTGGGITYPNGPDGALWVQPLLCYDTNATGNVRGRMPGFYSHMHSSNTPLSDLDLATNVAGISGATLRATYTTNSVAGGTATCVFFDQFGPWT
jgi:hypothetical protein